MKTIRRFVLVVAVLVISTLSASASTIALDFVGTTQNRFLFDNTLGWSFTVNTPIAVDGLGFFDDFTPLDGLGLLQDHKVTLWTDTGTLLAQTTITNASTPKPTTAPDGRWLFNTIVPVTLLPGDYVIGAFNHASPAGCTLCDAFRLLDTATENAAITFISARSFAGADQFPSNSDNVNDGYFGPNFTFTPAADPVPEPTSLLLLGTGTLLVVARLRSRRRKS